MIRRARLSKAVVTNSLRLALRPDGCRGDDPPRYKKAAAPLSDRPAVCAKFSVEQADFITVTNDGDGRGRPTANDGGRDRPEVPAELDRAVRELGLIRSETRAEIGLLHDRVNALLAAEAFLTIAYTAAMSNGTRWGRSFALVVAPLLSVLGLLLALFAGAGIYATTRFVTEWTRRQRQLLDQYPAIAGTVLGWAAAGGNKHRAVDDQRRSLLFFRAVPVLFGTVWAVLTVVAFTVER